MTIPGARPCQSPKCSGIFVWLANRKSGSWIPVDVTTLSDEERERIHAAGHSRDIDYDGARHVSHYRTCADPNRFSSKGKKK